jgi:gp16 family phage-associated protein
MAMTPAQVKRRLQQEGKTQKEWAQERGYRPEDVNRILNGTWKGTRGKGHEIAVELGLKDKVAA